MFTGTKKGIICLVDTKHIMEGQYNFDILPGAHLCKVDFLITLQGKINAQGFISSGGFITKERTRSNSMYYARQLDSVPCTVLMSIGVGYQELFTSRYTDSTCFIKWALPYKT